MYAFNNNTSYVENSGNSIKKKFIDIIFNFHIINKDVFYKDLYFKGKVKSLLLKNCKKDKNYKLRIYKYNQSVMGNITRYWIEKFNIDNISEIDDIDKLNLKNLKNFKPVDFKEQIGFDRDCYDGDNLENINVLGRNIQSGDLLKLFKIQGLLLKFLNVNYFLQVILKKLIKYLNYFLEKEI